MQFAVDFVNNIIITSQSNLAVFLQVSPINLEPRFKFGYGRSTTDRFRVLPLLKHKANYNQG